MISKVLVIAATLASVNGQGLDFLEPDDDDPINDPINNDFDIDAADEEDDIPAIAAEDASTATEVFD